MELHQRLCSLISSSTFENDLPGESQSAAPHEIMSAIIGIKEFGGIIGNEENKELFARCIMGYKYAETSTENEIKNCFICMLNSKVIDVDRLDYLIRDAYTSGFATTSIDYVRLLNALTIIKHDDHYKIAYEKDAVSIIENVVYAHDAERKWIQNHPVVVYEAYVLKRILENLNNQLNAQGYRLFSEQSLSKDGHKLSGDYKVSLMCDDDIIYLAKNAFPSEFSEEFFDRNKRRHPVWKSEAEYKAYIEGISTGGKYKEYLIEQFKKELEKSQDTPNSDPKQFKAIKRKLSLCYYLKNYVAERDLPFDFIIIPTNMFISNFSKKHLGETLIAFGGGDTIKHLDEVCNLLKSYPADKDFYYLFYRRGRISEKSSGKIDDLDTFCDGLFKAVIYPEEIA